MGKILAILIFYSSLIQTEELKIIKISSSGDSILTQRPKNTPLSNDQRAILSTHSLQFVCRVMEYNRDSVLWRPVDQRVVIGNKIKALNFIAKDNLAVHLKESENATAFRYFSTFIRSKKWESSEFETPPLTLEDLAPFEEAIFYDQYFSQEASLIEKNNKTFLWKTDGLTAALPFINGQKIEVKIKQKLNIHKRDAPHSNENEELLLEELLKE